MRKITSDMENPIDDILLDMCESTMETLHQYNFTPNMITTIGNVFRLFSIYSIFHGHKLIFVVFYLLGYYFDCLDGHYARKYNMATKFGDYYDHISDIVFNAILIYYIFWVSPLVHKKYYWNIVIIYILFFFGLNVHFGCQQSLKKCGEDDEGEFLDMFKNSCFTKDMIHWTKYFGSGTFISLTALLAVIF